jgi:hypothetical protein
MAVKAENPRPEGSDQSPRTERRALPVPRPAAAADTPLNRPAPTVGVHWKMIRTALFAAIWFVAVAVIAFRTGHPFSDYILWVVAGFALIFFGLTLGLARRAADDPRWNPHGRRRTLADAIDGNVDTATGAIPGRAALVELLTLPITLAIGATVIAAIFIAES